MELWLIMINSVKCSAVYVYCVVCLYCACWTKIHLENPQDLVFKTDGCGGGGGQGSWYEDHFSNGDDWLVRKKQIVSEPEELVQR